MAVGFGASDILVGIKIAWKIYQTGFVEENRADVRYRNFRNDIQGFAQLLEQLNKALDDAHLRFKQRSLAIKAAGSAYDPLATDFDTERSQFIGPFVDTLTECEKLLADNKTLRTVRSNPYQNLRWDLFTQNKIDDLRKRIDFHSSKVLLVIDRLSFGLLTDLDAKVDDLLGLSEQNLAVSQEIQFLLRRFYDSWSGNSTGRPQILDPRLEDIHVATSAIELRFSQQAKTHPDNKTKILDFPRQIPLAESFDALLTHFEKSLEQVEHNQTPDQYLSLLKARWLLENVKLSKEYDKARPGFYYKRAIAKIEQALLVRVRSNAVIKFDDSDLLALPDTSFAIWNRPGQMGVTRPDPTTARADEREVIKLDLVSDGAHSQDTVTVLQRSDSHFRVVIKSITDDHVQFIDKTYFAHDDKLIPRYALPGVEAHKTEVAIFSRREESLYHFHRMSDVFLFQSVLMGYQISHHERGVRCKFSNEAITCTGDIQIWQDPIISNTSQSTSLTSPLSLTSSSSISGPSSPIRQSSITAPSMTATTVSRVQDGYQAKPIAYPAISIFAVLQDRHGGSRLAILYIKLDRDIRLFTEQCGCGDEATYDQCPFLSIERPERASFPVHVHFSDLDSTGQPDPNTWDLSPFRIPEHPQFKRLRKIETTFLLLRFPSPSKKRKFHEELNDRFELRKAQRMEQSRFLTWMMHRQDRPERTIRSTHDIPHPQSRSTSFASTSTGGPAVLAELKGLDFGTDFRTALEQVYVVANDDDSDRDEDPTPVASQILQGRPTVQTPSTVLPNVTTNGDRRRRNTEISIASTTPTSPSKRSLKVFESLPWTRKKS